VWFAASRRKLRLTIFLPLKVNGIWSDEIDGETPSIARETRALPKTYCIDPAKFVAKLGHCRAGHEFDIGNLSVYSRLVKGLLAIFFSVMLIVSQAAASLKGPLDLGNLKVSTPKCCSPRPCCGGGDCCVGHKNSGSEQPAPAVPTQGSSQNDLQVLVSASVLVWEQTSTTASITPASLFVHPPVAAPLYQRDCSYLI